MGSTKSKKKSKNMKLKKGLIILAAIAVIIVLLVAAAKYFRSEEKVAATVNGEKIMKEEVLAEYLKVPVEYRNLMTTDTILEGMIVEKLLLQEADKMGITVTDEEVDVYTQALLDAYGITEENLTKSLEEAGSNMEELKEQFRDRLIITQLLNETIFSEIEVSEDEINNYYEENIAQFTTPEMVRASHILVNTSEEAESIRNKALEGVDFGELAKEYSVCPSSANEGDLGWFTRGDMIKEFEDAAFALKLNQISGIVETQYGFHIIKVTGKAQSSVQPFEEVKSGIEQTLLNQKQTLGVELFTQQLRANSEIEIFMRSVKEPEGTPITEIIQQQKEKKEAEQANTAETAEPEESSEMQTEESEGSCLASKGVVMYGSDESAASNEQKSMFGDDFAKISYIDCSKEKAKCDSAKITSYPTWVISGKKYAGKYSLTRLAELAGC
ncbi:peptidylprolyl isomerase [Candidatus Woesearchaeota archaeon]|nr:peptidylprolyl isomerase [Candidatus Woesearchaeota archaeon]